MKVLYIAGPYSGPDYATIDRNIAAARDAAAFLANNGIGFLCPHMNSAHFEAITPGVKESFWKELDLKLLAFCDGLFMLRDWRNSSGARAEHEEAERLGLPIFYENHDHALDNAYLRFWRLWAAQEEHK